MIQYKHLLIPAFCFGLFLVSCHNTPSEKITTYQVPPEIEMIPEGKQYGLRAPEIELPDTAGNTFRLSDLRGKVVLVDFWASWCPPCRKENPGLVKIYEEFVNSSFTNGEGFTIVSVSLDRNRDAWLKAIGDDKLSWPAHLSDLEGARSKAAGDFGVVAIPSGFLLDQNGVIIGTNLRVEELEITLRELLKN